MIIEDQYEQCRSNIGIVQPAKEKQGRKETDVESDVNTSWRADHGNQCEEAWEEQRIECSERM